ncbi:MAG: hypothetical protein QOH12_37 [Solirubrobacteraceae bacterium]|jgi:SAM-dependent methyltransferase|nr:hypothetical protein [Solirubrobacteraceae bacterium]
MDPIARALAETAAEILAKVPSLAQFGLTDDSRLRHDFELRLIDRRHGLKGSLWDLGAGSGLFAMAASRLGMDVVAVDDYLDLDRHGMREPILDLFATYDVEVIDCDIVAAPPTFEAPVDVVTTLHTMEHLHASPKQLYQDVREALAPGGLFVLAGPNAVNARKRLTAPFGRYEWSTFDEWYHQPVFRAHVREPRVQDLHLIAQDMRLSDVEVIGANFLGRRRDGLVGWLAQQADGLLRKRPSLCSDLYLIGSAGPD